MLKIGGRSILDAGRGVVYPLVDVLARMLGEHKLILGTGGGARTRHVFSVGLDLGMPTGVLAQLAAADALGNAHILGALLAPYGVVAIPPEMFGHLLPLFVHAVPGVIFNGVPPYSIWEHPPAIGRIPPHRTDAGCFLLAECFGCKTLTLVKDVDGLYDRDPKLDAGAEFIREISAAELERQGACARCRSTASCCGCSERRGCCAASRSSTATSPSSWPRRSTASTSAP